MSVTHETAPIVRFVADYDVPISNPGRRRAFYRELQRLRKKLDLHGKMSTASVLITSNRELAIEVFNIASHYGRANLGHVKYRPSKGRGTRIQSPTLNSTASSETSTKKTYPFLFKNC